MLQTELPGSISLNLAAVIESELEDPEVTEPVTLGSVLAAMDRGVVERLIAQGRIEADENALLSESDSVNEELRALIEDFGADQPAEDFLRYRASEDLAVVIEADLDQHDGDQPPTLGSVLDSMTSGLLAELEGVGDFTSDEEQALIAEIQRLIRKHGEDAPAEDFLP